MTRRARLQSEVGFGPSPTMIGFCHFICTLIPCVLVTYSPSPWGDQEMEAVCGEESAGGLLNACIALLVSGGSIAAWGLLVLMPHRFFVLVRVVPLFLVVLTN